MRPAIAGSTAAALLLVAGCGDGDRTTAGTAPARVLPAGHFDEVLLTKDTNALEPRVLEYKLYARGVGPVLALGLSGGGGREELVQVENAGLAAARAAGSTPLGETYP